MRVALWIFGGKWPSHNFLGREGARKTRKMRGNERKAPDPGGSAGIRSDPGVKDSAKDLPSFSRSETTTGMGSSEKSTWQTVSGTGSKRQRRDAKEETTPKTPESKGTKIGKQELPKENPGTSTTNHPARPLGGNRQGAFGQHPAPKLKENIRNYTEAIKFPICMEEIEEASFDYILIHGFPMVMSKDVEAIETMIQEIATTRNLQLKQQSNFIDQKNDICLEEKGCFAVLVNIKPTRTRQYVIGVQIENPVYIAERARPLKPFLSGTFIKTRLATAIKNGVVQKLGVVRGLEGSLDEVCLRLTWLQIYGKHRINNEFTVVAAHFLQCNGPEERRRWMHISAGYILTPELEGDTLTTAYEELKMFQRTNVLAKAGPMPGVLELEGVFKYEIYRTLTEFYAARHAQRALLKCRRILQISGFEDKINPKEILEAAELDGLYDKTQVAVIFSNEDNRYYKGPTKRQEFYVAFNTEVPSKEPKAYGKLHDLSGGRVQINPIELTPGMQQLIAQISEVCQHEGMKASPWTRYFPETEDLEREPKTTPPKILHRTATANISYKTIVTGEQATARTREQQNRDTAANTTTKIEPTTSKSTSSMGFKIQDEWFSEDEKELDRRVEEHMARQRSTNTTQTKPESTKPQQPKAHTEDILTEIKKLAQQQAQMMEWAKDIQAKLDILVTYQQANGNSQNIDEEGATQSKTPPQQGRNRVRRDRKKETHPHNQHANANFKEDSPEQADSMQVEPEENQESTTPPRTNNATAINAHETPTPLETYQHREPICINTTNMAPPPHTTKSSEEPRNAEMDQDDSELIKYGEITRSTKKLRHGAGSSRTQGDTNTSPNETPNLLDQITGTRRRREDQLKPIDIACDDEAVVIRELENKTATLVFKNTKKDDEGNPIESTHYVTLTAQEIAQYTEEVNSLIARAPDEEKLFLQEIITTDEKVMGKKTKINLNNASAHCISKSILRIEGYTRLIGAFYEDTPEISQSADQAPHPLQPTLEMVESTEDNIDPELEEEETPEEETSIPTEFTTLTPNNRLTETKSLRQVQQTLRTLSQESIWGTASVNGNISHRLEYAAQTLISDEEVTCIAAGEYFPDCGDDEIDRQADTNPHCLHVTESDLRYKIDGEFIGCPGLGVINLGDNIRKGTKIGEFRDGEKIYYDEVQRRIKEGKGEYIILPTQAPHLHGPYFDFHKSVKEGTCKMSRVNAPGGLYDKATGKKATANCSIHSYKTKDGQYVIYLKATKTIRNGEELLYNYGKDYKMTLHGKTSFTLLTYEQHLYKEMYDLDLQLAVDFSRISIKHKGYTLRMTSLLNSILMHELLKDQVKTNKTEIKRLLTTVGEYTITREISSTPAKWNRGNGFCGIESLYTAHCQAKGDNSEICTNSMSPPEIHNFRKSQINNFCAGMLSELPQQYVDKPMYREDTERALHHLQLVMQIEDYIPMEYWLPTTIMPLLDPETPKAIWIRQTNKDGTTSNCEMVETITQAPHQTYIFNYQQILEILTINQHIRFGNAHYEWTSRQPGLNAVLDKLMDILTDAIYLQIREREAAFLTTDV